MEDVALKNSPEAKIRNSCQELAKQVTVKDGRDLLLD